MTLRSLAIAAAVAAFPVAASATIVTTIDNQTHIFYDNTESFQDIGVFDLSFQPVGVTALFIEPNTTGSLTFGVRSGGLPARGSIDVNIISNGATFSGTFDGTPLDFTNVKGDFVAEFGTSFDDEFDVATFFLEFSGFNPGDEFQVNVAAIPLPASILMLMGALGGLAFIGRRRSA